MNVDIEVLVLGDFAQLLYVGAENFACTCEYGQLGQTDKVTVNRADCGMCQVKVARVLLTLEGELLDIENGVTRLNLLHLGVAVGDIEPRRNQERLLGHGKREISELLQNSQSQTAACRVADKYYVLGGNTLASHYVEITVDKHLLNLHRGMSRSLGIYGKNQLCAELV